MSQPKHEKTALPKNRDLTHSAHHVCDNNEPSTLGDNKHKNHNNYITDNYRVCSHIPILSQHQLHILFAFFSHAGRLLVGFFPNFPPFPVPGSGKFGELLKGYIAARVRLRPNPVCARGQESAY